MAPVKCTGCRKKTLTAEEKAANKEYCKVCNEKNKCKCCKAVCEDGQKALNCEMCMKWLHITCIGMEEKWYDMIHDMNESKVGLHWFCHDCDSKAIDMMQSFTQMKTRQDEMESRFEAMEKKLNDMLEMKEATFAKKVKNVAREESFDVSEREKRALNVVINGLPEVEHIRDDEKKAKESMGLMECSDDQEIITVFAEKVGLEPEMIESCTRIPEKRKDDGTPRFLLVKMKSMAVKRQLLDKAKTYRESKDAPHGFKNVYVNNDLTRQERTRQYNLRVELRRRRKDGEHDIMIKGDEIVKRDATTDNSTRTDDGKTNGGVSAAGGSAASGDSPQ